ncbi:hypothetical protein LIP_1050 [Limnochorda pilosa]|uniref:Transport permease protein n=1 Tax=Limnochorda pilosa TaxID=1555112 RepID=A0A0K2SIQ5_LIMPI|nr:hypothetical protein LIP_1050 [Limnochorda pilosa]
MRHFFRVVRAEAYKQMRAYWGKPANATTEALYPALQFATAYYMFKPFLQEGIRVPWQAGNSGQSLALFLLTGFFGFTLFQRLLWAAMGMTQMERFGGTLEIQYMTPASRFALLIGAAAGGLVRTVYLYATFLLGALVWLGEWHPAHPGMILVAFAAVVVPGLAWGTLLNGQMLFARDFSAYVSILQPPLNFFGGVRFPVHLLPGWMQVVSAAIPLTWSLHVFRLVLLDGATLPQVGRELGLALLVSAACFALACLNVHRCERLARERGTMVLY